jgi:hypothetical protein
MIMLVFLRKTRSVLIGLLVLVIVLTLTSWALFLMNRYVFDSLTNRKRVADRVTELARDVRERPENKESLMALAQAAESRYDFERCFALDALGRLGSLAKGTVPTITRGLESSDPYIRDAAAHALARMGKDAAPARKELVKVVLHHVGESAARYAVLALGEIGDGSAEVLDALKYAAQAVDSDGRGEARKVYENLTGKRLPEK